MRYRSIYIILVISLSLFFSSCMMMGPGHHMTPSINKQQVYYDPVCGNQIDTTTNNLHLQYNGATYYFHTNECLNNFNENPGRYLIPDNHQSKNYFLWGMGSVGMAAMMILMFL